MNRKAVAVVSGVILVVLVAFWLRGRNAEPVRGPVASVQLRAESPSTEHTSRVSGEKKKEAQVNTREELFPTAPGADTGFIKQQTSGDFETYLVFMGVGSASEIVDGRMADAGFVQSIQNMYGLTDDELARLVDYSRSALESDRAFQASGQHAVCENKTRYQSVEQFGAALNEYTKRTQGNQELLGRSAAKALGSELYFKINDRILSSPRREVTNADFPVLMAKRNHGLDVEVGRFCNFGK